MLKGMKKEARFQDGKLCHEQSQNKVVKFCKTVCFLCDVETALMSGQARKRVPRLHNFKFDWVTMDYLHRSMANRCAYLKRLSNAEFTNENGAGPSGTHHDDEDGDDSNESSMDESDESNEDNGN